MLKKFLSARKSFLPAALLLAALPAGAAAQNRLVVTGPGDGHPPVVNVVVRGEAGDDTLSILAYPRSFTGGVRVATGDVNGDGVPDFVAAPGPGVGPHVHVFDGDSLRRMRSRMSSFVAYNASFLGGVYVAAGDINGDGRAEIVTGQGEGGSPHVKVFDAATGKTLHSFLAYEPSFRGGVRVATGDVDGDGRAEIITGAGPGGGPHVKVFSSVGPILLHNFFPYDLNHTSGVFVAAGDVNGDGRADIITGAGPGGGPHVKVFDASDNLNLLHSFFAFEADFSGGVTVAAGDVNGDHIDDVITGAGPGAGPRVRVFDSTSHNVLHDFFAYGPSYKGGVYVAGFSTPRRR